MDDLRRALDFLSWFENSCAERVVPWRWGVALFHGDFPKLYMLNFVRVEGTPADINFDGLVAEADSLHTRAGLAHRGVVIEDARLGGELAPEFRRSGWEVSTLVLMAYRGSRELPETEGDVREITADELRAFRARSYSVGPSAKDRETVKQMMDKDAHLTRAGGARFFGAVIDGQTACGADLYSDGTTAQIESVLTLEPYRKRGLARAVVTEAIRVAYAAGNDFVFLLADDEDWPKGLYARMGFEPIGRCYDFLKAPG